MCGIIAVLRRKSRRTPPPPKILDTAVTAAIYALDQSMSATQIQAAADALIALDRELRGVPGLCTLLADEAASRHCADRLRAMQARIAAFEQLIDADEANNTDDAVEQRNAALVQLKDALWAVLMDRLPNAAAVREFAAGNAQPQAIANYASIVAALSALDRLEVRGRDSAGISVIVSGIDPNAPALRSMLQGRIEDPLFQNHSVRVTNKTIDLVYKHAAEIGELGDNTRALRSAMRGDPLLQALLRQPAAEVLVLGHTRWASVGIISQQNAHPLNNEEAGRTGPYVLGVLNGDVDNHHDLILRNDLHIAPEITTDAKVIPVLVSRQMAQGRSLADAFRHTVSTFDGSVAIAVAAADEPHLLALSLRGSGQALYVGLAEDTFVIASEPYGVIEECTHYLRMDGESPGNLANPAGSRGQVIVLDRAHAGEAAFIARCSYDGTPLPIEQRQLATAAITTRDIDRAGFRHFLLKEISEAPRSLQKTLRGRIQTHGSRLRAVLPESSLPIEVVSGLQQQRFRRILVIGQGTAAVAGQAVAAMLSETLAPTTIEILPLPASELSGFCMRDDMRDTLIVAISQSGTTTDTNRTVDLVRGRGALVIAIVNRRGSDLCDKADGILFTSDGRDIEMSVASTKAFYAQCAAGCLLALSLARAAGVADDAAEDTLLHALTSLPQLLTQVLQQDSAIAAIARRFAPSRRHWALVGNGKNRIAAEEVRIKLSELCYQSIACDATEDKKHIDLSSEPLILLCAAGLLGSSADDVAKEVAIYKAHKACPIVIATAGEQRFHAAAAVIFVPAAHPSLAFILSTMAGHLFGYRAALAIDELALPLRRARGAIEEVISHPSRREDPQRHLPPHLLPHWLEFRKDLMLGRYDGPLSAKSAALLTSLFNYALGLVSIDSYAAEFGKPGSPFSIIDALAEELTHAIDQLTRPVDAIKHQAKTVTVGISRSDEALLTVPLVRALLAAGATRTNLGYRDLRALSCLDPAVVEVLGSTRYRIDGDPASVAQITVIDQRGIAQQLSSRTKHNSNLRGTKHTVALERLCLVVRGRSDERIVLMVPEVLQNKTIGITLLHLRLHNHLPAATLRGVLGGYRNRFAALSDAVTETEPDFDESLLEQMPVADLLVDSILVLADRWRAATRKP